MRLLPTLLGLAAIAHGQYSVPQDEISSTSDPSFAIDCSVLEDGNYAGGCFSNYVSCAAGIAYSIDCPSDLLFDNVRNQCVYPEECGVAATTPSLDMTTVVGSTSSTSEATAPSTIDCGQLKDGFYSEGCTQHYTVCTYGVAAAGLCSSGLVYDMITHSCEYPELCGQIRTTPPVTQTTVHYHIPTTTENSISTTNANDSPFDCQNKPDGDYALDCSNEYVSCFAGMAVSRQCPLGLFFSDYAKHCQLSCESLDTTIVIQDTATSTAPKSDYVTKASASTSAPVTVPPVSETCDNGQVSSLGNCSSKFQRCRCEQWISAVCPGSSVFDELSGLCLYSLPRCYTGLFPTEASPVSYPTASTGYEESSQSTNAASPVYQAASQTYLPHWEHDQLLVSNPFFTQKKHHRHGKKHGRSDKVHKMGKLRVSSKSVRVDDHTSYVTDAFRGPYEPYVHSNSWSVFPRSRVHRMHMHDVLNRGLEDGETIPLDEEEIVEVTSTTASPSTESPTPTPPVTGLPFGIGASGPLVAAADEVEGSGDEMLMPEESVTRRRRSYGSTEGADHSMDRFCRGVASSTLVSVGFCRQEFILCRSYVAHLAGCPVGDLYDEAKNSCVPASICGIADASVCETTPLVPSSPTGAPVLVTATSSFDSSAKTCAEGFSGILAPLTCSRNYAVCDNGVEITMWCPEGLFYNSANGNCDYAEAVSLCEKLSVSQTESTSTLTPPTEHPTQVPYITVQTTPDSASASPYVPSASTPSILPLLSDACSGTNSGFVAAEPCATSFIVCSEGKAVARMNCPSKLVFNGAGGYCEYPTAVPECPGYAPATVSTTPISVSQELQDIVTTTRPATPTGSQHSFTGACEGIADGYVPAELCSNSYMSCVGQKVIATMYCSTGLVFNDRLIVCVRPEDLDECLDFAVPVSTVIYPQLPSTTTTAATATAATTTTSTTTTVATSSTVEPVYVQPVSEATEVTCPAPLSSAQVCSPEYTLCSNGVDYGLTCPSPLVFNKDRQVCDYKEFVAECAESVTATTSATTITTTEGASSTSTAIMYATITESTTSIPVLESTPQRCSYDEKSTGKPLGLCSSQYVMCQADETLKTVSCELGLLFDSATSQCVPAAECGRPVQAEPFSTTTTTTAPDTRCSKLPSSSGIVAIDSCSNDYLSCNQGIATTIHCRHDLVYSTSRGRCMRRQHAPECRNIVYVTVSPSRSSFCAGREDNLYRDPQDCAGIVQCHGGDLFKHIGCSSGLVFNDETKQCDYRQNVEGCEEKQESLQKHTGCNGAAHGAYIADESKCNIFYRCVWNFLVEMRCPAGTVFNPTLSVCDWPSAVPQCSQAGSPATDLFRPY